MKTIRLYINKDDADGWRNAALDIFMFKDLYLTSRSFRQGELYTLLVVFKQDMDSVVEAILEVASSEWEYV